MLLFALAFLLVQVGGKRAKRVTAAEGSSLVVNGVTLSFTDPVASPTLLKWAHALSQTENSVTHSQAASRERFVVEQVPYRSI